MNEQCQAQGLWHSSAQAVLPCAWHYPRYLTFTLAYGKILSDAPL